MSDIGERIKELCSEAGITQLQLGDYAGCIRRELKRSKIIPFEWYRRGK